ncbi:sulfurtransferase complex subunit TusB [Buchnera aphidicola (Kurisakia onigurumii)]|uniref:sulfurtransferase complex subunit TusB n=1 Tax=Buchnera aphidicola TaxID=9 RepID=UPI0031B675A7
MLHVLTQSPFVSDINLIINMIDKNDYFLAIQDGVIISLKGNIFINLLDSTRCSLFVLQEDLIARGIMHLVSTNFKIINYTEFVHLTIQKRKQLKW